MEMNLDYLSGFFDGEGSVGISKSKYENQIGYRLDPEINLRNTSFKLMKEIQEFLKSKFGLEGLLQFRGGKDNHKDSWSLRFANLKAIEKFIGLFKGKAKLKEPQLLLLEEFVISRMGCEKMKTPQNLGLYGYTKRDIEIYEELKKLNRRGTPKVMNSS